MRLVKEEPVPADAPPIPENHSEGSEEPAEADGGQWVPDSDMELFLFVMLY